MRKFFYREWWAYVLDDSRADKDYGPFNEWEWRDDPFLGEVRRFPLAGLGNYLARCWCRAKGHPCGVVWNSSGLEPDMACKDCGEDLG
jgi:hypothetical protein